MKTKIYIVAGNTDDPGHETIFGLYPSLELARERIRNLEAEYEVSDWGYVFGYESVEVDSDGADCRIRLR